MRLIKNFQFVVLLCLLATRAFAQDKPIKANEPTAISRYFFVSEEQMHLCLGIKDETASAIMFQKDDSEAKKFMANSLAVILDGLKKNAKVTILPVETLKGKVTYSRMGFPLASVKKAAKKSNYGQYVAIDIAVVGAKTITSTGSNTMTEDKVGNKDLTVGSSNTSKEFFPRVTVTLKFADGSGQILGKYKGEYTHPEKVAITTETIDINLVGSGGSSGVSIIEDEKADQVPYYVFLAKAVETLAKQLP